MLQTNGLHITLRPDINFNCAVIDKAQIWYGSVNILGFHSAEDNIITFRDAETAGSLLEMLYK